MTGRLRLVAWVSAGIALSTLLGMSNMSHALSFGSSCRYQSADDKDYSWKLASGPNGERDESAVPLYKAVINGDLAGLERLLKKGQSPNQLLYPKRWSALMVASMISCPKMVKLLLDHGADVNYTAEDAEGKYALDVALTYGIWHGMEVFYHLLDHGADMTIKRSNDSDVVIHAAVLGQMKLVNELLDRGYRSDLPQLLQALEIIQVNEETQPYKQKAMVRVKALLSPQQRADFNVWLEGHRKREDAEIQRRARGQ
jgi:hypothetical protein